MGRGLLMPRLSREEFMIKTTFLMASRSTCNRLQVGCVFARDNRIICTGYNGAPSGMPHCGEECNESTPCLKTAHAEANGIAWAARHGIQLLDTTLYVTHSPCVACAMLIINAGVENVIYYEEYRLTDGIDLLNAALIPTRKYS